MVVQAEADTLVTCTSRDVLELVLDLDRYRQADTKIGRVIRPVVLDQHGHGSTRYWGHMRGLPPAPDTNLVKLTPWTELTFTGAPHQPGRLVVDFQGTFRCEPTDAGCRVTHRYELSFHRPWRWIYGAGLQDWLQREVIDEMARLAALLDTGEAGAPPSPD